MKVSVNKQSFSADKIVRTDKGLKQINYVTANGVSSESILNAAAPIVVNLSTDSYIEVLVKEYW